MQEQKTQPIVSHWHTNLTIGIVTEDKPLQIQGLPEPAVKSTHILYFSLMSDIHLFFKDGKRSYYPIVSPSTAVLISGLCKRLLASKGSYARDQFNREVTASAH
jgi:hypothetical protein